MPSSLVDFVPRAPVGRVLYPMRRRHMSPMEAIGFNDGLYDTELISSCPPIPPLGPQPPNPDYPVMYERGYRAGFDPSAFHQGCKRCTK